MATQRRVAAPAAADRAGRYFNRELSAPDLYSRILDLAEDASAPLLERVKFAAIVAGNLDRALTFTAERLVNAEYFPPPRPVECSSAA